jgi:class 3 adenylate cyclase
MNLSEVPEVRYAKTPEGVHIGYQVAGDGPIDLVWPGVSYPARVSAMVGPGEALASSTVKDLVAGSGLAFGERGEHELTGVPDRRRLYRVVG